MSAGERKGAAGSNKQHAIPLQAARAPPCAAGAGAAVAPGAPGSAFAGDWDACKGSVPSLRWSPGWELCCCLLCLSSAGCDRQSCSCPLRSGAACKSPRSIRLAILHKDLHKDLVLLLCRPYGRQHSLQPWLCQSGSNGAIHWRDVCSLAAVRRPRPRQSSRR